MPYTDAEAFTPLDAAILPRRLRLLLV